MTRKNDATEANDLRDAPLNLELSEAGNPSHEETVILRRAVIDASVALRSQEPGGGAEDEVAWERIPWDDPGSLPEPGMEMIRATTLNGRRALRNDDVVRARPELDPGWVRVKLRSAEEPPSIA